MKLDINCVRSVLLELESLPSGRFTYYHFPESVKSYGDDNVYYCLAKLVEANYVNGNFYRSEAGTILQCEVFDMTFAGHQFLETIRPKSVWQKVLPVVENVGSFSIQTITEVATSVISQAIAVQLGLQ